MLPIDPRMSGGLRPSVRLEFWKSVAIVTPLRPARLSVGDDSALSAFFSDLCALLEQGGCNRILLQGSELGAAPRSLRAVLNRFHARVLAQQGRFAINSPDLALHQTLRYAWERPTPPILNPHLMGTPMLRDSLGIAVPPIYTSEDLALAALCEPTAASFSDETESPGTR